MRALRAEGHSLRHLLECSGLRRSTYYYALAHPRRPTRPELRDAAAEIFSRTANGCGHRQIAMCLRAELGAVVAVSVNIIFTISTNAFSPIAPTRIHRIRQRGCAAFGA